MLGMLGWHIGILSEGSAKLKGCQSNGFGSLDLNGSEQLALAILKTAPKL
jgi:hypothetical protein